MSFQGFIVGVCVLVALAYVLRPSLRRWLHLMLFAARDDDPRSAMLGAHVTLRARSM